MPTTLKRPREDTSLRDRLESLAQAIRDKDVDAIMAHYAPDVVVFDVLPPPDTKGSANYRKNFERWFETMPGPIAYEMSDLHISQSESHAFCHFQSHVKGTKPSGEKTEYSVRVTTCLQKANGQWLVAHEHVSVPMPM
jgi:ketosteroid isomerase-like protein